MDTVAVSLHKLFQVSLEKEKSMKTMRAFTSKLTVTNHLYGNKDVYLSKHFLDSIVAMTIHSPELKSDRSLTPLSNTRPRLVSVARKCRAGRSSASLSLAPW